MNDSEDVVVSMKCLGSLMSVQLLTGRLGLWKTIMGVGEDFSNSISQAIL